MLTAEDRKRHESQKQAVLEVLQSGETITQVEAGERFSIMRLASRISELRRDGWAISTTMIPLGDALVAEYRLDLVKPRVERQFLPVEAENIPNELKELRRWVVWRAGVRGGRISKIPYTISGNKAKSNDPRTWSHFNEVMKTYEAGRSDGVGFVFSDEDDIVGIDLDKCIVDGAANPQAQRIVEELDSFTELSVSGGGLHVICRANLARGVRCGPVEVYPHGRYFTVTGHLFEDRSEVKESQSAVDRLVALLRPPKPTRTQGRTGGSYITNDRLIERAMSAANGAKFKGLWEGAIGDYNSHSEADLALLSMLMFWCNGDEDRVDVLFRQSGLCRSKWTERDDYRRYCFERLRGC